jgi:hypothetical protein
MNENDACRGFATAGIRYAGATCGLAPSRLNTITASALWLAGGPRIVFWTLTFHSDSIVSRALASGTRGRGSSFINMSSVVRLRPLIGQWSAHEVEVLVEIQQAFFRQGLATDYEHGIAEDGSPWITFYDTRDGSFVGHVARDREHYVLICSDRTIEHSPVMSRLVEIVRNRCEHDPQASGWVSR